MARIKFDKSTEYDSVSFSLVNQDAVKRLKRDKKIDVPEKKVDIPKDERWNEKQMASKVMRGIQNGDDMYDIAQSMIRVVGNNVVSAMRNTRTMVTSAENNGRFDSYKALSSQGVVLKKKWEATPDDRTRPSHLDMDGEEQDLDEEFSNKCMFPGDGNGPAEEVWNCRCAMGTHIVGFRRRDGSISYIEGDMDKTRHDERIEEEKERRARGQ